MTKNQSLYLEQQKLYLQQLENSLAYHYESISNYKKIIELDTSSMEIEHKRLNICKEQIEITKQLLSDLESEEEYECIEELELVDNTKFEKGHSYFKSALSLVDKEVIKKHFIQK